MQTFPEGPESHKIEFGLFGSKDWTLFGDCSRAQLERVKNILSQSTGIVFLMGKEMIRKSISSKTKSEIFQCLSKIKVYFLFLAAQTGI